MSWSTPSWLATSASSRWTGPGKDALEFAWSFTAAHIVSTSGYEMETLLKQNVLFSKWQLSSFYPSWPWIGTFSPVSLWLTNVSVNYLQMVILNTHKVKTFDIKINQGTYMVSNLNVLNIIGTLWIQHIFHGLQTLIKYRTGRFVVLGKLLENGIRHIQVLWHKAEIVTEGNPMISFCPRYEMS